MVETQLATPPCATITLLTKQLRLHMRLRSKLLIMCSDERERRSDLTAPRNWSKLTGFVMNPSMCRFCEVSPGLAAERGLEHGGWATIVTARAANEARVLVTRRLRPLLPSPVS